jgi:ketosteroid isomerase-like protein
MSRENVELVRRAIAAFNSGSVEALAEAGDFYDPEVEFHEDSKLIEAEVHRGPAEVEAYFERWLESFESYSFEIEEIVDSGDKVAVFNRQTGRGRGSGAEVDMRTAWVFELRNGRIRRITPHWDRDEALAAVSEP